MRELPAHYFSELVLYFVERFPGVVFIVGVLPPRGQLRAEVVYPHDPRAPAFEPLLQYPVVGLVGGPSLHQVIGHLAEEVLCAQVEPGLTPVPLMVSIRVSHLYIIFPLTFSLLSLLCRWSPSRVNSTAAAISAGASGTPSVSMQPCRPFISLTPIM